jgi:hypothetical protein
MKMNNNHITLLALVITSLSGCFGDDKPSSTPTPPAPAAKRALSAEPLAAYDLTGRPRTKPCATMGALEAEPGPEKPLGKKSSKDGKIKGSAALNPGACQPVKESQPLKKK